MSEQELPAGRLVKVEFEVCLPVAATRDQVEEWITHNLEVGGLGPDNPLYTECPEPFTGQVILTDTGMQGRREEFATLWSKDHQ